MTNSAPADNAASPRVSIIVLGFNQADLIDQAIDAAFAQTYTNLEIVLSDDGSSDATYDRMRARAAEYRGPHIVKTNQTAENRGTLAHIYDAFAKCTGSLILLAAGDDLSKPHRAERLAQVWQETGAEGLDSWFDLIDNDGNVIKTDNVADQMGIEPIAYFRNGEPTYIHGATSAYDRRVLESVLLPEIRIICEDEFFSLFLKLRSRKIVRVPEALVTYRQHEQSSSNFARVDTADQLRARERAMLRLSVAMSRTLVVFATAARTGAGVAKDWGQLADIDYGLVQSDIAFWSFRAGWMEARPMERVLALVRARRWSHVRFLLPRLFGLEAFVKLKQALAVIS